LQIFIKVEKGKSVITKNNAIQAADELMSQEASLRKPSLLTRKHSIGFFYRCPELNRLSVEQQINIVKLSKNAVQKDWAINLWIFVSTCMVSVLFWFGYRDKASLSAYMLLFGFAFIVFNLRAVVVKKIAQTMAGNYDAPAK
jgi:hypothetical protein